ncbi:MAG: hypothetical protein HON65_12375 [Rhodospirillales bacterium]|jgi:uncharacterized protein|nr:hypothetical protein [Rhodospirillales bacterium]
MHVILSALIILSYSVFSPINAVAQSGISAPSPVGIDYNGITIIGNYPPSGASFDVPIVDPNVAIESLIEALDLITNKSPFSVKQIETLKQDGDVVILYEPQFPDQKANFATLRIALFMPQFAEHKSNSSHGKNYIVMVSRHGIKWEPRELASVIVHELVGHGMQHFEDRLDILRPTDKECEAWLYEEMAHQDFGIDKFSSQSVRFKKELIYNCDGFLRHLRTSDPAGLAVWEVLNPDVPKLLTHFEDYLDDLRRRGVMKKTLNIIKENQEAEFEKIFNEGTADDLYKTGRLYREGVGLKTDLVEAEKWFEKAANLGHAEAQNDLVVIQEKLGLMYYEGQGVKQNSNEAIKWFHKAAERGNIFSQTRLAYIYISGTGTQQDFSKAEIWSRKAAQQGDATAQYYLGLMYQEGDGVAQDYDESVTWYRMAAEQGFDYAQLNLGVAYFKGQGVTQNYAEAIKWYRESAEQGNAIAQLNMGDISKKGQAIPQDHVEAAYWYHKAADQGVVKAQYSLGIMFEKGEGVSQNFTQAKNWYLKAADQGNAFSQYKLGGLYSKKESGLQDFEKSVDWYLKAADQGHAFSQYKLGGLYDKGNGVPQNFKAAAKWYEKAANQMNSFAQYKLGLLHLKGSGVPKDIVLAHMWLDLAASNGNTSAKKVRDTLASKMSRENLLEAQKRASEWEPN